MKFSAFKWWFDLFFKGIVVFISISCIVSLPKLIVYGQSVGFFPLQYVTTVFQAMQNFFLQVYSFFTSTTSSSISSWLPSYSYSMTILHIAVCVTILFSLLLAYVYFLLPARLKRRIANALSITEAIPDIFIITLFQYSVIFIYKWSDIKLFQIYGLQSNVYFMPIICLSLVPIFLLARLTITLLEEESEKDYVNFGKAKGLSAWQLFIHHLLRNLMGSMMNYFNVIYWSMLSSLFIIEYLFLMKGFTPILYRTNEVEMIILAITVLLIPYGLIQLVFRLIKNKLFGRVYDAQQ